MNFRVVVIVFLLLFACNDEEKTFKQELFNKPLVTDSENVVYNAEFFKAPLEVNRTALRFSEGIKAKKKSSIEVFSEELAFKFTSPDFKAAIFLVNKAATEVPCYNNLKAVVNATNVTLTISPSGRRLLPSSYLSLPAGLYLLKSYNRTIELVLSENLNCGVTIFGSTRFYLDTFNF